MSDLAIAGALYFDHELAADPTPFAQLVRTLLDEPERVPAVRQWHIDADNRKAPPPAAFDLDALVARIARGDLSVAAIESVPNTAPDEQVFVKVGVTPYSKGPERYSLTKCRYDAIIGLGARHVTKRALDAIVTFADAVAARTGAITASQELAFALGWASGGGSTLSPEQIDRITDDLYWRPRWGDVIRGPAWGTFLDATHVERLGGIDHLVSTLDCQVTPLRSGGAYIQLTSEPCEVAPSPVVIATLAPVAGTRPS